MKNNKLLLVALLISILLQNYTLLGQDYKTISINRKDYNIKDFGDIFHVTKVTQLEISENSFVGLIDKIKFMRDRILVLQRRPIKCVHIFDLLGKYISTVNRRGKGPNEYTDLRDIAVDIDNNEFYIIGDHRLLRFDHNGKPLGTDIVNGFTPRHVHCINSDLFAFVAYMPDDRLIFWSKEKGIINSLLPNNDNLPEMFVVKPFINYDGKIFHQTYLSDTIYKINGTNISPYVIIDLEKGITMKQMRSAVSAARGNPIEFPNYRMWDIRWFAETDQYIYFTFVDKNVRKTQTICILLNKITKKILYHTSKSGNSLFPSSSAPILRETFHNDFVTFLYPDSYFDKVEELKTKLTKVEFEEYQEKNKVFFESIKGFDENSNPLIIYLIPNK